MIRMGVGRMRLLSAPEYDSSSVLVRSINELVSATIRYELDGTSELALEVPRNADWLDGVKPRRVIWIDLPTEGVSEWFISGMSEPRGEDATTIRIKCDPLHTILRDVGIMEDVTSGGLSYTNLGGVNLSAKNYLDTFVVPNLTRHGIDWIATGTVDSSQQFDLSFDSITPQELIINLADQVRGEWRLRRDADNSQYVIDILDEIGSDLTEVWLTEGKNVLTLVRERNREDLYTVIRPLGVLPSGSEQRADIGFNAWKVTDITGSVLTLADPSGGPGPVVEDDQHVGLYVEAPDGTFTKITDSDASSDTVTVESASSISEGDHVMIVKDSSGTLLTEVSSPSGITEAGRVCGTIDTELRGERNLVPNAFAADWGSEVPEAVACLATGQSATTDKYDLTGLPAGQVVEAGDVFMPVGENGQGAKVPLDIEAGGTASGAGALTITLRRSLTASTSAIAGLVFLRKGRAPTGYTTPEVTSLQSIIPYRRQRAPSGTLEATANGAQSISWTDRPEIKLEGLTEGDVIEVGDYLDIDTPPVFALSRVVADANGEATVPLLAYQTGTSQTAVTDGQSVTITKPELSAGTGGYAVGCFMPRIRFFLNEDEKPRLTSPSFRVREIGGLTKLTVSARIFAVALSSGSNNGWGDDSSQDQEEPPQLSLRQEGSIIESADFDPYVPTGVGDTFEQTLRLTHTITADSTYTIDLKWPCDTGASDGTTIGPWVWLMALQAHLGTQEDVPFVDGSHATRLFQEANVALLAHRQWPATYTATAAELSEHWGIDPDSEALAVGGTIRARIASLDLDLLMRIVAVEFDLFDENSKTLTLDTSPHYLTQNVGRSKPAALFVDVDPDLGRQTLIPTPEPPTVPGTRRAVVEEGSMPPIAAPDIITIE